MVELAAFQVLDTTCTCDGRVKCSPKSKSQAHTVCDKAPCPPMTEPTAAQYLTRIRDQGQRHRGRSLCSCTKKHDAAQRSCILFVAFRSLSRIAHALIVPVVHVLPFSGHTSHRQNDTPSTMTNDDRRSSSLRCSLVSASNNHGRTVMPGGTETRIVTLP